MHSDSDQKSISRPASMFPMSVAQQHLATWKTLDFEERLEIIRSAGSKSAYRLLLESADLPVLVRTLAAQELYLLVSELGYDDALDLIRHARPGQIELMLDLDTWKGDQFDATKGLEWLGRMLELGEERVLKLGRALELEFWALMLASQLTVVQGLEAFDPDLEPPSLDKLAGIYEVEYRTEDAAKIVGRLLTILYSQDCERYLAIMETIRSEMGMILEEECFQFRTGRLLDLGFEDRSSALSVYSYVAPDSFSSTSQRSAAALDLIGFQGGLPLALGTAEALLAEVLAMGLSADTRYRLTLLLNRVMSADGVDIPELSQVRESMTATYRYLNLSLEHLAQGDALRAHELFESSDLQQLFRLGLSLTLDLRKRAMDLRASTIAPYLDGPYRSFLAAICLRHPRLFCGVDREDRAGDRAFATLHDLKLADEWLLRIETQRFLFEEHFPFRLQAPGDLLLEATVPEDPSDITLSEFFLTALGNRLLGREFAPVPIAEQELAQLHALVSDQGKLRQEIRSDAASRLEEARCGAGAFASYCFDIWEQEFCPVALRDLNPDFIGGLIIRRS